MYKHTTEIVNLTPHKILELTTGTTIKPSGQACRVLTEQKEIGRVLGIPIYSTVPTGVVEGLPLPKEGVIYLVSALANSFLMDRLDVLTVGQLTRGTDGKPVGCTGLRK